MNTKSNSPWTAPPSITARIAALPDLPMPEIKALWHELFEAEPPNYNRSFLERRIAYRLQEREFRQVNPDLVESNRTRIERLVALTEGKRQERDVRPVAGTILTREYRGMEHRVVVVPDGQYEYDGRHFPTLSMIAREITGTRWSGPAFFGLREGKTAKAAKGRAPR